MYGHNTNSTDGAKTRDRQFQNILENAAGTIHDRLKNYVPGNDPLKRSHLKLLWDIVNLEVDKAAAGEGAASTGLESPIKAVCDWGEPVDSDLTASLRDAETFFKQNYAKRRRWGSDRIFACLLICLLTALSYSQVLSQDKPKTAAPEPNAILWEEVDIKTRDLFLGPGGSKLAPDLENSVVLGRQLGGNNTKYRIRDKHGTEWVAKVADESQPETAAVRLLWGIGYKTEINYLIKELKLGKYGTFSNVRLEARPKGTKRGDRWMWNDNPFAGRKEFDGLKIMMAMFNNWDLKDENNAILITDGGQHYVISDLGASFGRLAKESQSRSGRSVNDAEDYAQSVFIKGARDGVIDFAYTGSADHLMKGIKVESGRWLADLLLQLSDKQINDAFRAARYSDEKAAIFTTAFKARINALDAATRTVVAAQ